MTSPKLASAARRPAPSTAKADAMARRYHHGHLREALIEAGLAALEDGDRAEFSLREIARKVGVSANAAYRHFEDKQALLAALAAEGFRRFTQANAMAARSVQGGERESRIAAGRAYIDFARAHPALFRLMFSRFLDAQASEELKVSATAAFQGLLEAAARSMGTTPDDERALIAAIARWSLVHGLSHLLLDGLLDSFGEDAGQLTDKVLRFSSSAADDAPR